MNKASLDLELTSGGTAILERSHMVEDGKPVEMTTLYYLDGGDVKLTHYCMAGNQPTMRGTDSPGNENTHIRMGQHFEPHDRQLGPQHHATYTFIDDNHFKTTWTFRKGQKDSFTEDVTYLREVVSLRQIPRRATRQAKCLPCALSKVRGIERR